MVGGGWTRVALCYFVCGFNGTGRKSFFLGGGGVLVKMCEKPTFSTFGVESVVFGCVSRAGVVVEGVFKLSMIGDHVGEEKTTDFGEFSL